MYFACFFQNSEWCEWINSRDICKLLLFTHFTPDNRFETWFFLLLYSVIFANLPNIYQILSNFTGLETSGLILPKLLVNFLFMNFLFSGIKAPLLLQIRAQMTSLKSTWTSTHYSRTWYSLHQLFHDRNPMQSFLHFWIWLLSPRRSCHPNLLNWFPCL